MIGLSEDLRYGLRALARNRGFTAVCVVSLALGIGANTTIFSLVNAILLRPLPVRDPANLVAVYTLDAHNPGFWGCSYANYRDYRDRNQVFSSLLLYTGVGLNLTGGAEPRLIMGQLASANYFSTLGVNLLLGRGFLPEDDSAEGASRVAVISNRFWQSEYGSDPAVLSRTVSLDGHPYRIVGVAPEGFEGLNTLTATDIWVPITMYPELHPAPALVSQRRFLVFSVVGRLKPGVTMPQAQTAMETITGDLGRQYPKDNQGRRVLLTSVTDAAIPPANRAEIQRAGVVLVVISVVVLLVACGNLASLLLARAAGRTKEIAGPAGARRKPLAADPPTADGERHAGVFGRYGRPAVRLVGARRAVVLAAAGVQSCRRPDGAGRHGAGLQFCALGIDGPDFRTGSGDPRYALRPGERPQRAFRPDRAAAAASGIRAPSW